MRCRFVVLAAFGVLPGPVRAQPVSQESVHDVENRALVKIDRKIAREPPYRTTPKYCLVLFGPKAKTRVWVVVDDDTVYVDLDGNGDLTEKGEKFTLQKTAV